MIIAGHKTDNHFQPISVLEVGNFLTSHPDWTVELRVIRPKQSDYYIPAMVDIIDGMMVWTPDETDTEFDGIGSAQVWARNGDGDRGALCDAVDVKFKRGVTDGPVEIPAPMVPYLEAVLDEAAKIRVVAGEVARDADRAEQALDELREGIASGDFKGEKGDKGDAGPIGPVGPKGETGERGESIVGPAGPKGDKGDKGDTGSVGPAGPRGEQGPAGPMGPEGERGETGPAGERGPAGSDADVTASNIAAALGYTPADGAAVEQLSDKVDGLHAVNLLPYHYYDKETTKKSGIDFTLNPDGSVLCNGTTTSSANYILIAQVRAMHFEPGTYTISGITGGSSSTYQIFVGVDYDDGKSGGWSCYSAPVTFTLRTGGNLRVFIAFTAAGVTVNNLLVKPMLERGSVAHEYVPPVDTARVVQNLAEETAGEVSELRSGLAEKQDTLVSGQNIKTINGESILGTGNIAIQGGAEKEWVLVATANDSTNRLEAMDLSAYKEIGYSYMLMGNTNFVTKHFVGRNELFDLNIKQGKVYQGKMCFSKSFDGRFVSTINYATETDMSTGAVETIFTPGNFAGTNGLSFISTLYFTNGSYFDMYSIQVYAK